MHAHALPTPVAAAPSAQLFRAMLRTVGLLKRVMEPHFTTLGISGAQWAILRTLHDVENAGEPSVRLSELGNRLLVRPPSVTGIVRRLRHIGLIDVQTSPADQRAKAVTLTDAGRQLVETFTKQHAAQVEEVFAGLDPAERDELLTLLTRLGGHLEHMADATAAAAGAAAARRGATNHSGRA